MKRRKTRYAIIDYSDTLEIGNKLKWEMIIGCYKCLVSCGVSDTYECKNYVRYMPWLCLFNSSVNAIINCKWRKVMIIIMYSSRDVSCEPFADL